MKITVTHHHTIKITVPAVRATVGEVPAFVPKGLISTDTNNAISTGSDGKLYAVDDTTDYLAHLILAMN